jgi:hypothetical protein
MTLTSRISLALFLVILGIAYAQNTRPPATPTTAPVVSSASGRYQIVMSTTIGANTFMLDTQTGKVWQWVTYTDLENDPKVWMIRPRLDGDEDLRKWALTQTPKKQP